MKEILAEIITIGDEILFGHITDTNSQWISDELSKAGVRIIQKTSVGDDARRIREALSEAEQRVQIILITGGLGPTNDDITKKTLAGYFNSPLILNKQALEDVTAFFKKKGKELSDLNKTQALLPEACIYIRNEMGTAPGMWFDKKDKVIVSMPGVPFEMKAMTTGRIIPMLKEKFNPAFIVHKEVKTVGIGESYLSEKIKDWEEKLPSYIKLAYLPSYGEVKLRLTASGKDQVRLKKEIEEQINLLQKIAGNYIYGYDQDTLPKVVGEMLREQKITIATAESCTGGLISYFITSIPGSSDYFHGGLVAYSNEIKQNILGVKPETLNQFGAVSEETVKEMAEGAKTKFHTGIGLASSGIAGPGGGTSEKPVGTVWLALADNKKTIAKKLSLGNDREINMRLAAVAVLNLLRETLTEKS
ncbi:MAG: competence/damage-inducible protein A [Cytophagaceae bacterium]|nr:competence/damage-inducible protein A [Cytophagaceae bacterium]